MDQNQRINQIMEALRMREESGVVNNSMTYTLTVTGTLRTALVEELVKLLTTTPVTTTTPAA